MPTPTSISHFAPASTRTPEDCERHYCESHTVWARSMLRAEPAFEAYHIARAAARYSDGAFAALPTRWRYVLLRRRPGLKPGLSAEAEQYIADDHRLFLQDWHGLAAEQTVAFDARRGQTAFEAYLLEVGCSPEWRSVVDGLLAYAPDAFGLRAVLVDEVQAEFEGRALDLPGQLPDRTPRPVSTTSAVVQLLFDQHEWAAAWFASGPIRAVLDGAVPTMLHRVVLQCGFDER